MVSTLHRTIVVLKLPLATTALVKVSENILTAMTSNPAFANIQPPLATVVAQVKKLDDAETLAKTRAQGMVQARNAARLEVVQSMHALKAAVQVIADANGDNGAAIITAAGMATKKAPVRTKPTFVAHQGLTSGSVRLVAKAAAQRASYEWQWSVDGGKTWNSAPTTLKASTTITGLPPATVVLFRYRAVTKAGEGDWSQVLSFLVH